MESSSQNGRTNNLQKVGSKACSPSQALEINFSKKVFGILAAQLILTVILTYFFLWEIPFYRYPILKQLSFYQSLGICIISFAVLTIKDNLAKQAPFNYIFLVIFTLSESYCLSNFLSDVDCRMINMAIAGLVAITTPVTLTVYAFLSKAKINLMRGLLGLFLFSLITASILFLIGFFERALTIVFFALYCMGFGAYIIYGIELMIENEKKMIALDENIRGALFAYIYAFKIVEKMLRKAEKKDKTEKKVLFNKST